MLSVPLRGDRTLCPKARRRAAAQAEHGEDLAGGYYKVLCKVMDVFTVF